MFSPLKYLISHFHTDTFTNSISRDFVVFADPDISLIRFQCQQYLMILMLENSYQSILIMERLLQVSIISWPYEIKIILIC